MSSAWQDNKLSTIWISNGDERNIATIKTGAKDRDFSFMLNLWKKLG